MSTAPHLAHTARERSLKRCATRAAALSLHTPDRTEPAPRAASPRRFTHDGTTHLPSSFERPRPLHDDTSITSLLADLRAGRREAFDQIVPLVYHELRRSAQRELAARPSDTLSTTALVHELYLKLSRSEHAHWRDRAHFLGVAAVAMRHILVDRARKRFAEKRGGPHRVVTLDDALIAGDSQAEVLLELHEALDQLAQLDERLARVVECRFFGGMTEKETAEALHITERTVRRDWVKARGLLHQALGNDLDAARAVPTEN